MASLSDLLQCMCLRGDSTLCICVCIVYRSLYSVSRSLYSVSRSLYSVGRSLYTLAKERQGIWERGHSLFCIRFLSLGKP
jgi:hypothetical protein